MSHAAVSRSESESVGPGVREIASFAGADGSRMLSLLHLPVDAAPRAAMTLAPSLLTDRVRTYRAEVETARLLAARGLAVHRFDYRGFGHSDDFPATSHSMLEDIGTARSIVAEAGGVPPAISMGIGWGALVAACSPPGRALIMWEPPSTGTAYLRDAKRAHKIAVMGTVPSEGVDAEGTEVLGFDISHGLESSAGELSLDTASPPERVLWITTGKKLGGTASRVVESWRAAGSKVDDVALGTEESWWFIQAGQMRGGDLVGTTVSWIEEVIEE